MFDFFQALSEFLKSDLAKGYGWTIIALVVVCMIFSGFVVWFYMEKIKFPSKKIELHNQISKMDEVEKENQELKKQNDQLKAENEMLKKEIQHYKFEISINNDKEFEDRAVDTFAKENRKKRERKEES